MSFKFTESILGCQTLWQSIENYCIPVQLAQIIKKFSAFSTSGESPHGKDKPSDGESLKERARIRRVTRKSWIYAGVPSGARVDRASWSRILVIRAFCKLTAMIFRIPPYITQPLDYMFLSGVRVMALSIHFFMRLASATRVYFPCESNNTMITGRFIIRVCITRQRPASLM